MAGQESGVRSQESGVRSQESGVRSQESGVRSQESGVRSQESGVDLGFQSNAMKRIYKFRPSGNPKTHSSTPELLQLLNS
jgi:hypothetical protein